MATTRFAATEWHGPLTEGSGTVTLESSGLGSFDVTWASRTEDPNGRTSPEELIAAAHSSCFSMALSSALAKGGTPPTTLHTRAEVDFQPGEGITGSGCTSSATCRPRRRRLPRGRRGRQAELPGLDGARGGADQPDRRIGASRSAALSAGGALLHSGASAMLLRDLVVAPALRHVGERTPGPAGELAFAELLADRDRPAERPSASSSRPSSRSAMPRSARASPKSHRGAEFQEDLDHAVEVGQRLLVVLPLFVQPLTAVATETEWSPMSIAASRARSIISVASSSRFWSAITIERAERALGSSFAHRRSRATAARSPRPSGHLRVQAPSRRTAACARSRPARQRRRGDDECLRAVDVGGHVDRDVAEEPEGERERPVVAVAYRARRPARGPRSPQVLAEPVEGLAMPASTRASRTPHRSPSPARASARRYRASADRFSMRRRARPRPARASAARSGSSRDAGSRSSAAGAACSRCSAAQDRWPSAVRRSATARCSSRR